jgi:hypothetical protein
MKSYRILCFLFRDECCFPVTIGTTETVYDLKELILKRWSERLRGVDPDDLHVRKVCHSGSLLLNLSSKLIQTRLYLG